MEVVNGNVDAWIYDQLSIMNFQAKHPDKTRALLTPLREESWAIGLRQGDDTQKTIVNETLARMRQNGQFTKLAEQYMAKERQMLKQQGLPFLFELP
jgi:polar amino acid transport system substrate-binding protein